MRAIKQWMLCVGLVGGLAATAAMATPQAPPPLNIAPVVHPQFPATPAVTARIQVVTFTPPPSTVQCAEGRAPLEQGDPLPAQFSFAFEGTQFSQLAQARTPPAYVVTFDIAADGRPHALNATIARPDPMTVPMPLAGGSDPVGAVIIASWRFGEARAFTGCNVRVDGRAVPLRQADRADVLRIVGEQLFATNYSMAQSLPFAGLLGQSAGPISMSADAETLRDMLLPTGSDCYQFDYPHPTLLAFPDDDTVPDRPGSRSWALVAYDVGADGVTANARVVASSGNASLDKQSLAAVATSRFARRARTGCLAGFRHEGPPLPWPSQPPVKAPSECPIDPKLQTGDASNFYPQAYRQRGVEGWALIRFDLAPWGEVGDVSVVAAEPAAAFGEAAMNIVRASRPAQSEHGYSGCVTPIRFRMPAS